MMRTLFVVLMAAAALVPANVPNLCGSEGCSSCEPPHPLSGIYPTILIPWTCSCEVDEAALEAQLRHTIAGGVQGVLILGSIGEGEQASPIARAQMLAATSRVVGGTVPIIVGIHTCDSSVALTQMHEAKAAGATAVLVKFKGCPKACGTQVLDFFQQLAGAGVLPILYYHYPSDTGLKLTPCEIGRIVQLPGVVGAKISTFDLREFRGIRACGGPDRVYLAGSALMLTQFLEAGGNGAMCPEAVLLPERAVCAFQKWQHGCRSQARQVQKEIFVVAPLLVKGPSTEFAARSRVMLTQDFELPMYVRDSEPQARLKATLNGIGVPTSSRVSCGLTPLRRIDQPVVDIVAAKIRRRF